MTTERGLEANKRTVLAFYDAALTRLNVDEAVTYFGPKFTNHNPRAEDGVEGFRALLAGVKKHVLSDENCRPDQPACAGCIRGASMLSALPIREAGH